MERVQSILKRFLEGTPLAGALAGWRGLGVWDAAVGPEVAKRARATAFRDGALVVEVTSSTWMNELTFLKPVILDRLAAELGPGVVRDIQFVMANRPGRGRAGEDPERPGGHGPGRGEGP
jgi:predicted nucleic acid-binding Zn ribbon protein